MIVDLVFTIIHFIPFFLHAFCIRSAVVFSLGSFESAIVTIATVIGLSLRPTSVSVINSLNFGTCIYFSSSVFSTFLPILYFADKFHSFFSLKGKTFI